mgnify:CR=1 FL=1
MEDFSVKISESLSLEIHQPGDIEHLVKYLNDPEVYRNTLKIPFPYTDKDAADFFKLTVNARVESGRNMHWKINKAGTGLIGGLGLHGAYPGSMHKEEFGYWLSAPFRGQGLMTEVLMKFCPYIMAEYGYTRLEAPVFSFNTASAKVLMKCGFQEEGMLRKAYLKDGQFIDARLFAKVI